jgi:hypothetical protein
MNLRIFAFVGVAVVSIGAATIATPAFAGGGGGPCGGNGPVIGETPVTASAGQMTAFDGRDADVGWQNNAPDGSRTAVYVDASATLSAGSKVLLYYQLWDSNGNLVFNSSGVATSESFSVAPDLSSAHLQASGTVTDFSGAGSVVVTASANWIANGVASPSPQNGTTTQSGQGQTIVRHLNAVCQPAQATGVVTIPGSSNLAIGDEYLSGIDHIQSFTLITTN